MYNNVTYNSITCNYIYIYASTYETSRKKIYVWTDGNENGTQSRGTMDSANHRAIPRTSDQRALGEEEEYDACAEVLL